ncbi:DUF2391 domain-containing protein [Halorhabdus sp. CBA1104]|uniref:DUF2391 domain-containing protein n=1 Tax=unclassified Halorhabdus TaxID=2621901 RepID=UPI0012B31C4C|nr:MULTISPECIES: DUF2391 domain-containing protein [unclassified Halorhabdus]QGN06962.1 DUF2391 domain-containing protein [Halorhabdus sp. CBA1104]
MGSFDGPASDGPPDQPNVADLLDELDELEATVDSPEERERVESVRETALSVSSSGPFGRVISGFDRADASEALLGSVLFGIPMFVEGGTSEVGNYLAAHPYFLVGTVGCTFALVAGILYVAEIQDVRVVDPYFGFIPQRFAGVLVIASVTALVLMTLWGRLTWSEPLVVAGELATAILPMAVGGALGDILPGS